MSTLQQNRVIATDQTSGAVQRQAVKPSTIGGAQRGAEATRAANSGSSRRAGPGATIAKGEKFTGKQARTVVADWTRSVRSTLDAMEASSKALKAAKDAGLGDDVIAAIEEAGQMLLERLMQLGMSADDMAALASQVVQAQQEHFASTQSTQSTDETPHQPDAEGVVESNTGELPREGMDSAASTVVMDHLGKVSPAEPGTFQNPYVVDAARIESSKKKAGAILGALNPERVRAGLPDEVLTDMNDPRLSWNQRAE